MLRSFCQQISLYSVVGNILTTAQTDDGHYRVRAKRHVKSFLLLRNPTFHLHKYVLLDRPDPFIFQGALKRVGDTRLSGGC